MRERPEVAHRREIDSPVCHDAVEDDLDVGEQDLSCQTLSTRGVPFCIYTAAIGSVRLYLNSQPDSNVELENHK